MAAPSIVNTTEGHGTSVTQAITLPGTPQAGDWWVVLLTAVLDSGEVGASVWTRAWQSGDSTSASFNCYSGTQSTGPTFTKQSGGLTGGAGSGKAAFAVAWLVRPTSGTSIALHSNGHNEQLGSGGTPSAATNILNGTPADLDIRHNLVLLGLALNDDKQTSWTGLQVFESDGTGRAVFDTTDWTLDVGSGPPGNWSSAIAESTTFNDTVNVPEQIRSVQTDDTGVSWGGAVIALTETPLVEQKAFRFRDPAAFDTVGLNANTDWLAALNTDINHDQIGGDTEYRIRFLMEQDGGYDGNGFATDWRMYFRVNAGSWTEQNATPSVGAISAAACSAYTDQTSTTQVIGAGTFTGGVGVETSIEASGEALAAGTEGEFEIAFTLDDAALSDGDTIDLVLRYGPTGGFFEPDTITQLATITIVGGGTVNLDGQGTAAATGSGSLSRDPRVLAAQGDAAATGSAALTVEVRLDGQGNAAATGDATLTTVVPIGPAQGDAAATGTGALTVEVRLDGQGNAAATGDGSLSRDRGLAADGHAAATGTASLTVQISLDGQGNAAATGDAALVIEVPLDGQGNAAATGSGDLRLSVPLDGQGNAAATGAGDLTVEVHLDGQGNAAATGSGELSRDPRALDGQGDAAATGAAEMTVTGGGDVLLDGQGNAAATGSASMTVEVSLSGQGDAAGTGAGDLAVERVLDGQGDAAATGTAAMTVAVYIDGTGTAASTGSGAMERRRGLSGQGDAAAEASGAILVDRGLDGQGDSASSGSAVVSISRGLTGQGDAAATGTAALTIGGAFFWQPSAVPFTTAGVQYDKLAPDGPPWS